MADDKIKVTVITPVFNGAATIRDCIQSVKKQDYPHVEHLVVDGGSSDGTIEILADSGIKFISEKDAGIYDAFNKGICYSDGDLIHILNSDDYYAGTDIVSRVVSLVEKNSYDLCHGLVTQIDINHKMVWTIGCEATKKQLLKKMKVAHPSLFIKKEVYSRYGAYSVGFKVSADHEFLLRIWDKVKKGFIPETLVFMRLGGASNSQVKLSYRESLVATILHGKGFFCAFFRYYWELFKHFLLVIPLRKAGYKKR